MVLVTALGLISAADMSLTVNQLTAFIKSAVKLKQPDKQVAEYLHHVKMTEKLDDQTIEELQGQGAGLKTVAALREMGDASAQPARPPLPRRPNPSSSAGRRPIPSSKQRSWTKPANTC